MGFEQGNGKDGKHYWLTPPDLMKSLQMEFQFNYDPCPYPRPDGYDGLDAEWGSSNYVNPPFGVVIHKGKKKGATAWVRKAIEEYKKGKKVVFVYPIDKWVLMFLDNGAKVRNLKDVKWHATEDGAQGPGTGRHIAMFILDPKNNKQEQQHLIKLLSDFGDYIFENGYKPSSEDSIYHWQFKDNCQSFRSKDLARRFLSYLDAGALLTDETNRTPNDAWSDTTGSPSSTEAK